MQFPLIQSNADTYERFLESNGKETSLTTNCTPEQNASPGPNK